MAEHMGAIVQIWGEDTKKLDQFIAVLGKTLQSRSYSLVELKEQEIRETLTSADQEVLARAVGWAAELLRKSKALVVISASPLLAVHLTRLSDYIPDLEVTFEAEFMTSAVQHLRVTAEIANLPQEISEVILLLEAATVTDQGKMSQEQSLSLDENVYSADEEARLEDHLRSLGYL